MLSPISLSETKPEVIVLHESRLSYQITVIVPLSDMDRIQQNVLSCYEGVYKEWSLI